MTPGQTVDAFIAAIERKDLEAALEFVTPDIEYDNVPMGKNHGLDGIRSVLAPFVSGCSAIEWVIHRQVEQGDIVMNERTDRFQLGERWIDLPVAGLFELRDGRICLWRDYFDATTFTNALAG